MDVKPVGVAPIELVTGRHCTIVDENLNDLKNVRITKQSRQEIVCFAKIYDTHLLLKLPFLLFLSLRLTFGSLYIYPVFAALTLRSFFLYMCVLY